MLDKAEMITLSVVYDGAPEAGKTTSVRALATSLGRTVFTPEEIDGRTSYFDWMEYEGGRYNGAPIRCQVTSVPGQTHWADRRKHILDAADVVVFVGDTTAPRWPETLARLRALREAVDEVATSPVGIVFQANKRDRDDAVAITTVREAVAPFRIGVFESVASDGSGIREAFVFAVRLALDRLREEERRGNLARWIGVTRSADDLLASLAQLAPPPAATVARPPSADAPVGGIWPPVDGRVFLHETAAMGLAVRVTADGDWVAGLGVGWRVHSRARAVYDDLDRGRDALVAWARPHAAMAAWLSPERCIVLSEAGPQSWRLWQIVQVHPSLQEELVEEIDAGDAAAIARSLVRATTALLALGDACLAHGVALPCDLASVAADADAKPRYVGLVPTASPSPVALDEDLLARDLAWLVAGLASTSRSALYDQLCELEVPDDRCASVLAGVRARLR